jgi:hypothetical protein
MFFGPTHRTTPPRPRGLVRTRHDPDLYHGNSLLTHRALSRIPETREELRHAVRGAAKFEPDGARQKKRAPFKVALLEKCRELLDIATPKDVAVWTATTTAFFAVPRIGDLTVKSLKDVKQSRSARRPSRCLSRRKATQAADEVRVRQEASRDRASGRG